MREIKTGDKYLCKSNEWSNFTNSNIYNVVEIKYKGVFLEDNNKQYFYVHFDDLKTDFTDLQEESKSENVTPLHYQTNSIDVIDFCKLYNLNFNLGNIVKYACRVGKKENDIEDLKKVIDYAQREIKYLQTLNNK